MNFSGLRIDDIGASTKKFEVYSDKFFGFGNLLFLKYAPYFKKWGPYRELTVLEWEGILGLLEKYKAKLTVGITACWVEADNKLTPFPQKFPKEAAVLKKGLKMDLFEIANHGLTHCVVGKHLPRLFSSNRRFHREFLPGLPGEVHADHLQKSQEILRNFFETEVITFIPPGNAWTKDTEIHAQKYGIEIISSLKDRMDLRDPEQDLCFVGNDEVFAFHDRKIVLEGLGFMEELFKHNPGTKFISVKELVALQKNG